MRSLPFYFSCSWRQSSSARHGNGGSLFVERNESFYTKTSLCRSLLRNSHSFNIVWMCNAGVTWHVPADDELTSLAGAGSAAARPHGAPIFSTTNWSVVLEAQGQSPAAQEALEKLCSTYWPPVNSFIRREGTGPEEAEDLTQRFFALLLQRRNFDDVRKEKGRLRSYLLTSLKHFLVSEHRRAVTVKRGKGQQPVPLDELGADGSDMEPADHLSADRVYERRWALTLMEQVLRRL